MRDTMKQPYSSMIQVHVFRRLRGELQYLLLKRADSEALYPGMWQMVTGMLEAGESAPAAALREMLEETGLRCTELLVVPWVSTFYMHQDDRVELVPVFAAEVPASAHVTLSEEHQEHAWLNYDEAWRRLLFPGHREGQRILRDYVLSGHSPYTTLPGHD